MTNLYCYKNFMTYKIINYKGILNLICENICLSFLNAMSIKFEGGGGSWSSGLAARCEACGKGRHATRGVWGPSARAQLGQANSKKRLRPCQSLSRAQLCDFSLLFNFVMYFELSIMLTITSFTFIAHVPIKTMKIHRRSTHQYSKIKNKNKTKLNYSTNWVASQQASQFTSPHDDYNTTMGCLLGSARFNIAARHIFLLVKGPSV